MIYLQNCITKKLAHKDSRGQHDGLVTDNLEDAASFNTWAEAAEFSQDFSSDWDVLTPEYLDY